MPDPDNSDLLTIKFSHLVMVFCFETNLLLLTAAVKVADPLGNPELLDCHLHLKYNFLR